MVELELECKCGHAWSNHSGIGNCYRCSCVHFEANNAAPTTLEATRNDTPTRFTEIVPIEYSYGIPQMGPAVGMINIDTIVAFQVPKWGSSQGPTPFVAITGERGHVKMAYIELWALFADKQRWHETKDKWLQRAPIEEGLKCLPEPQTSEPPMRRVPRLK